MGKYLIADVVWEFNFPKEFNQSNYEVFKTDDNKQAQHTINFELVEKLEKLETTNYEEFGLKMYVENNIKLFDIFNEQKKVVVKGKYTDNTSTYQILNNEDLQIIDMLSFMRLAEVIAKQNIIALNATALIIKDQVFIPIHENVDRFINQWVSEIDTASIFGHKLFIKVDKNIVRVYSNPWSNTQNSNNVSLPLHSILVLSKGRKAEFVEIKEQENLLTLALHLGIMTDTLSNEALMQFCIDLVERVNIFKYQGNIDIKQISNKLYFN